MTVSFSPTNGSLSNNNFTLQWNDTNQILATTATLYINNIPVSTISISQSTNTIIFNNIDLTQFQFDSYPIQVIGNNSYNETASINFDVTCFLKGTEILCLIDNEEKYIKIEDISDDTMIKTYKHGYKKLLLKSHQKVHNNIVCMKKDSLNNNVPFNDLKVTTGHSMLVDNLTDDEITEIEKWNPVKKIDDKFLILSRVSKYFEEYDIKELNNVYHLILEADDLDTQYGIYANGVLMESMSKQFLEI